MNDEEKLILNCLAKAEQYLCRTALGVDSAELIKDHILKLRIFHTLAVGERIITESKNG